MPPTPAPAAPTLSLAPGATLTRGDTLTANVSFNASGQTMNVTAWRYVTASDTVTRPAGEANFQSRWSGVMALSGMLEMDYTITPAGGTASPVATLRQSVTVNDRTGAAWTATPTLNTEAGFTGQPSPPRQFNQLGRHNVSAPALPTPTTTTIASGPNAQFIYTASVTAGNYVSQPLIHPDLTTAGSRFNTFHQNPSRLYLLAGAARTLIPLTEYSGLSIAGGTLSFTVPDWEAFYKRHNFYTVTANDRAGGPDVPLRNAWWRLASNAEDAAVESANDAAIRTALRIPSTQRFNIGVQMVGSWEGFQLMQATAILTGTRSHEYQHMTHSHRANFQAMLRALDPQRKIESTVGTPTQTVNFNQKIQDWWNEILKPNHELVDEAASRTQEQFVPIAGAMMAGVNTDPATGAFLGSVWDITGDQQMT